MSNSTAQGSQPVHGTLTVDEIVAPVTVTGTVSIDAGTLATAAKQDTGNTSLATLAGAVAGTEVQADVLTLPAITGSVTANAGTNLNTSTLALETTLSTLNGKVTAVNTGAVTISAALPAGANAIGKLAANSGVDIGDVDVTSLPAITLSNISVGDYETVAADQTAQVLGATGAIGDYIAGLLIVPALLSPGQVLLLDNATSITVFAGGISSVATLIPFFVPLGIKSVSGAWKVTTGASVSVIAMGNFT